MPVGTWHHETVAKLPRRGGFGDKLPVRGGFGDELPYRGRFGEERPSALAELWLPPRAMPSHDGLRPLKAWRYVGVYNPEMLLCLGVVRVGPLRQSFWAVWDRARARLRERTLIGRREVDLTPGGAVVRSPEVQIELRLEETAGVETISRTGDSYAWTRKQGGVTARGVVTVDGVRHELDAWAIVDDSAGYHERHTSWRWCAGVGRSEDGRELAWNLVDGVHDGAVASERTVWVGGEPHEVDRSPFEPDLSGVGGLRFQPEAVRQRRDNLIIVRSSYRQPFGTFSGELPGPTFSGEPPGGLTLAEGYGVMEEHDAWW